MEVVAARPQSNNETNEFIKDMESAATEAIQSLGRGTMSFTGYAVDGVSGESKHVCHSICVYISKRSNHTGSTDNNHNVKSWHGQVITGAGTQGCTIGLFMIDLYTPRAHVSINIWLPGDFASYLLVLHLTFYSTIQRLSEADTSLSSTSTGDKGVMGLTLFFMRLQLYTVNGKSVQARHRAVHLWCSMLWLTSIYGASIITKRSIVAETIDFMFLVLRSDIPKTRHCKSEACEHFFGCLRTQVRELSCLDFVQTIEKHIRRLIVMYKHLFHPSRDPQKGYQSTFGGFFKYTCDGSVDEGLMTGTVILDDNGDSVADQMWEVISSVISYSSDLMNRLFATVGAQQDEVSPFCSNLSSLANLRDELIRYLPRTFNYDTVAGNGIEHPNEDDETGGTSPSIDEMLAKRIKRFCEGYV